MWFLWFVLLGVSLFVGYRIGRGQRNENTHQRYSPPQIPGEIDSYYVGRAVTRRGLKVRDGR